MDFLSIPFNFYILTFHLSPMNTRDSDDDKQQQQRREEAETMATHTTTGPIIPTPETIASAQLQPFWISRWGMIGSSSTPPKHSTWSAFGPSFLPTCETIPPNPPIPPSELIRSRRWGVFNVILGDSHRGSLNSTQQLPTCKTIPPNSPIASEELVWSRRWETITYILGDSRFESLHATQQLLIPKIIPNRELFWSRRWGTLTQLSAVSPSNSEAHKLHEHVLSPEPTLQSELFPSIAPLSILGTGMSHHTAIGYHRRWLPDCSVV
jgi:hypothetical protein